MLEKASIFKIPCYFDKGTSEIVPRYGYINHVILFLAIDLWCDFWWLFSEDSDFNMI